MALEPNCHPDDEIIETYSLGRLGEDALARTEEHLLVCEDCRERVEFSDSWVAAVRTAAREQGSSASVGVQKAKKKWFFSFPQMVPAFAALALFALFGTLALRTGNVPAATVFLAATRGPGVEIQAPAKTPLQFQFDQATLPPESRYSIEIVDSEGAFVEKGSYPGSAMAGLTKGLYFVRVSSPQGQLYREYGLRVAAAK